MNNITKNFYQAKAKTTVHRLLGIFVLALSIFSMGNAFGQISMTSSPTSYSQNFDGLATNSPGSNVTWTSNTTIAGWFANQTSYRTYTTGDATPTNRFWSCGSSTSSTERSFGSMMTSTTVRDWGVQLTNNTGSTLSSITIGFDAERWYTVGTGSNFIIQYSTTVSAFGTAVTSTTGASTGWTTIATISSPAASLSYTLPSLSLTNGSTIFIRFFSVYMGSTSNNSLWATDNFTASWGSGPSITAPALGTALTATYGTASGSQTSAVVGSGLSAGITATAQTNFEVSSDNISFNNTASLPQAGATLYVRLKDNAPVAGSYNDVNAVLLESGATSVYVKTKATGNAVSKKPLTITGLTGADKPYDGNTSATYTGTPVYTGLVSPDSYSGTLSASFSTSFASDSKSIAVTGTATANYTVTQLNLTGNITKVPLTITAGNQSVTYGTAASAVTNLGSYTTNPLQFVNGENASVIGGSATYSTTYDNITAAGTSDVTITPIVTGLTAVNYSFTPANGTITITKANSTITVTGTDSFTYDGNPQGPTTYNVSDPGSSGAVTFNYTNAGLTYDSDEQPTSAGSYFAVATVAEDTNYNGASSAAFPFTITSDTQPEIDSALTASATYGVAATTYTITGSNTPTAFNAVGLPNGLNVNASTGEITGTPTDPPGAYNVTISATNGTGSDNAVLVYTILAKELTVSSAVADDKVYDRTVAATFSGTLVGIVNSDDVSLVGTGTFAQVTVGTGITVTSTATLGGSKAAYYTLTGPTGLSADITQKELTVTGAVVTTKTYTGTADAAITGATLAGVIAPDAVTLVNNGGTFADVNVANGITVTSAFTLTGGDNGNYSLTQPSLTGNITPAPLTITGLTGDNKPYDGNTSATFTGTPAYSGLQNGESFPSVTGTPVATFATADAGNGKTITINGYDIPSANYTVTATLTANITKVALTITANNQSVGYGTAAATVTGNGSYTASGFVNGPETITGNPSYTTSYTDTTAVGASGVTITPGPGTLAATNYTFGSFVDGTITVTIGTQTITLALSATKKAGFADYSPATSATSGINPITYTSDNPLVATVVNGGTQIHYVGIGDTNITASQAASANYSAAADVTQALTVAKAKVIYVAKGSSAIDATVRMLTAENFEVTTFNSNGTTAPSLSGYDLLVIQESFDSTDAVLKTGAGLGFQNLTIPVIYNKAFAFRSGRNLNASNTSTSAGVDSATISSATKVSGQESNPIFNGISDTSIPLLKTIVSSKGINYATPLTMSGASTLLATPATIASASTTVFINDIPANTQLGSVATDKCPSRMITFGFNNTTLLNGDGKNLTNEYLTVWRNAAYILTGQTPPSTLYLNPDNDQSITFGALATKKVGDSPFALTATSAQTPNSGNAITYTSSPAGVVSIAGSTVTILGRGTTTITASQAAGGTPAYWYAAPSVPQNLVVNAAAPVITGNYCVGGTTVSGTSTEPDGTDIIVYKAGDTQIGATTVTGGAWTVTVAALDTGDSLTATAGEGVLYVSLPSAAKVVNALPVVTASNVSGCPNTDIALIGSPLGGVFSITNPYNDDENTSYTYTYTDGNGCTNTSDSATVTLGVEINFNNIDDNCDGSLFEGHAPVVVDVDTASGPLATMGTTITSSIATNTVGSVTYKFKVTKTNAPTSVEFVSSNTTSFVFSSALNAAHSSTYNVQATAIVNGEEQPYNGNTRTFSTPAAPTLPNPPTQAGPPNVACAYTLATISSYVYANNTTTYGANRYEFLVERMNGATVEQTISVATTVPYFKLTNIAGIPATMQVTYGTTYRISVRYGYGAVSFGSQIYTAYGTPCLVSTPSLPVASVPCNTDLASVNAYIYASGYAAGASQFEFKVTRVSLPQPGELPFGTAEETIPRNVPNFKLTMLTSMVVGLQKQYSVSVRYTVNAYGSSNVSAWSTLSPLTCLFSTPNFPETQIIEAQCGVDGVPSATNQNIYANAVAGATHYRFRLYNEVDAPYTAEAPYSEIIDSPNNYIKLNQFPSLQAGVSYSVTVVPELYGEYANIALAQDCSITAPDSTPPPSGPAKAVVASVFQATAYPNPFANNFMINVKSESQSVVNLKVYDMIGRLIEQREARVSDLETSTIGDRYPSGVYNVVVSQEDNVQTLRVVKR